MPTKLYLPPLQCDHQSHQPVNKHFEAHLWHFLAKLWSLNKTKHSCYPEHIWILTPIWISLHQIGFILFSIEPKWVYFCWPNGYFVVPNWILFVQQKSNRSTFFLLQNVVSLLKLDNNGQKTIISEFLPVNMLWSVPLGGGGLTSEWMTSAQ